MKPFRIILLFFILATASAPASASLSDVALAKSDDDTPGKGKLKDLNRRKKDPFGINAYGFGPVGLAAVSMDYFITPKVALEAGGGWMNFDGDEAFTVGARYHLFGKTFLSLTPYVGIYSAFHYNGSDLQNHSIYLPAGLHKIRKTKFSWSIEVAYQRNLFMGNRISGGIRLGYRF